MVHYCWQQLPQAVDLMVNWRFKRCAHPYLQ